MNLKQYQIEATRTCASLGSKELDDAHMQAGIFTEFGEMVDVIKKHIAYGKPLDWIGISEESADVCFYYVNWDRIEGIFYDDSLESILEKNVVIDNEIINWIDTLVNYQEYPGGELQLIYNFFKSFDLDFAKALDNNIAKLKQRFPDKFDTEKALNRDLDAERRILER